MELEGYLDGFGRLGGQGFRIWSIVRPTPRQSGTIGKFRLVRQLDATFSEENGGGQLRGGHFALERGILGLLDRKSAITPDPLGVGRTIDQIRNP